MARIFNLIIVDESGSMSLIRRQAFDGINRTILTIREAQQSQPAVEQTITLLTFDSSHTRFIYDGRPAALCRRLGWHQYEPGGGTPLYDAIGRGISKVNSQCAADDHVLVTIITDGEENCSREYTHAMVANLIAKLREQHWTFTFIGTDNLDVEGTAQSLNIDNHLAFTEDPAATAQMFERERRSRSRYYERVACGDAAPCGAYFNEDE